MRKVKLLIHFFILMKPFRYSGQHRVEAKRLEKTEMERGREGVAKGIANMD